MSNTLKLKQYHKNLINVYKKIHTGFFFYSIFVILTILASLIFMFLLTKKEYSWKSPAKSFDIQQLDYKGNFEKFINQEVKNKDIQAFVFQGLIREYSNKIQSINNLLTYKWFIVPKYFYLDTDTKIKDIGYFEKDNYDLIYLKNFIQNIVLVRTPDTSLDFNTNTQLPLHEGLITQFNLECAFKWKAFQWTCKHYISNFLDNFYIYDIKSDYQNLHLLFNTLSLNKTNKLKFCENLKKYSLYANDIDFSLEDIFYQCGLDYLHDFRIFQEFVDVQRQLWQWVVNNTVYNEAIVNEYKLLSLQQLIYTEIANGKINDRLIYSYLLYLQNILKEWRLSRFYSDELYRFNNYYLNPELENYNTSSQKILAENIINEINIINKGNKLIGFNWLISLVQHKDLVKIREKKVFVISKQTIDEMVKQLDKLSFFTITKSPTILDNEAIVEWFLLLDKVNNKVPTQTTLNLHIKDNVFVVNNIILPEYSELEQNVNKKLKEKPTTLAGTYSYINSIFDLYDKQNESSIWLCDRIGSVLTISSLAYCSDKLIILERKEPLLTYKFKIKEGKINWFRLSDPNHQELVETLLSGQQTNYFTLPNEIKRIVEYPITVEKPINIEDENNLVIIDIFRNYLWIIPYDIRPTKNNSFFVNFMINDIGFQGLYTGKALTELYFSNVKKANWKLLQVPDFYLLFSDENKTSINSFVLAPEFYLKTIAPNTYRLYLQKK